MRASNWPQDLAPAGGQVVDRHSFGRGSKVFEINKFCCISSVSSSVFLLPRVVLSPLFMCSLQANWDSLRHQHAGRCTCHHKDKKPSEVSPQFQAKPPSYHARFELLPNLNGHHCAWHPWEQYSWAVSHAPNALHAAPWTCILWSSFVTRMLPPALHRQ